MDTVKEEIKLAEQLFNEMEEAHEAGDIDTVGVKADVIKTIMKSIKFSCAACELANDKEIEPWDPEEEFCELDDEEIQEEDE